MAKVTITFEDKAKTVSFLTEIEGMESAEESATPAMALGMATRAMFENGMLAEAAGAALVGINQGELPSAAIIAHYKKLRKEE
jgi:hypothetical protein